MCSENLVPHSIPQVLKIRLYNFNMRKKASNRERINDICALNWSKTNRDFPKVVESPKNMPGGKGVEEFNAIQLLTQIQWHLVILSLVLSIFRKRMYLYSWLLV